MIEALPILGAALGVVIFVLLPDHWKGILIIAAIVLTVAAIAYNLVGSLT